MQTSLAVIVSKPCEIQLPAQHICNGTRLPALHCLKKIVFFV